MEIAQSVMRPCNLKMLRARDYKVNMWENKSR